MVKVEREGVQQGAALVQRSFEEFHELHCKLRLIFPSSKLPRYAGLALFPCATGSYVNLKTHGGSVLLFLSLASPLPSFPSRFVIGRSRGESMADRRKDELNGYVWHLVHAAPEVAQVSPRQHPRSGMLPTLSVWFHFIPTD